jgi:ABC-type amino acid transport substrate-binding protein
MQTREVGDVKRRLGLSTIVVAFMLAFVLLLSGCSTVTGQQTSATLDPKDPDALEADTTIAGITRSENIQVPATIQAGVLLAGSDAAFPPLAYLAVVEELEGEDVNKVMKPVGFEVDLCTAIAKKLGLTLQIVQTGWDAVVPALLDGDVDVIMSAMVVTPELQQEVSFTEPHLPFVLAINTPLDAPVTDAAGLAGRTVGVQADTVSESQVATITGVSEMEPYVTITKAFSDLAGGHVQAVVEDEIVSDYILRNDPDLATKVAKTGTIATGTGYAFATRKDDSPLLAAMDAALVELRADGVYEKICAKWDVTGN